MHSGNDIAGGRSFVTSFLNAKGAIELVAVSTVVAVGLGCVIGLVPSTITDRYAELYDGTFSGTCSDYEVKPAACAVGSDKAERVATLSNFCLNMITLLFNPVFGSHSDKSGRRPILLLSLCLSCLPATAFLLLLKIPKMNPDVYYLALTLTGLVNVPSITFATLSDVVPEDYRAQSFGILLVGFFGGFSFAPSIALIVPDPVALASLSLALVLFGFVLAFLFMPETLVSSGNLLEESLSQESNTATTVSQTLTQCLVEFLVRPFREMKILIENWPIRLLTLASILSAMVFASDATLVIYYIQEKFQIGRTDMAGMFFALGVAGMLVQGVLLEPMIVTLGEHRALILSFGCGCIHNLFYGLARSKTTICFGMILSQLTKANFPLLSSLASREDRTQQGRIQGALFAASGLGNAIGPIAMKWLQEQTPDSDPGIMFIYAAALYFCGTILVICLDLFCKDERTTSNSLDNRQQTLEQPLLHGEEEELPPSDAVLESNCDMLEPETSRNDDILG